MSKLRLRYSCLGLVLPIVFLSAPLLPSIGVCAGVGLDNAANPNYPPAGQSLPLNTWVDSGHVSGSAFGGWYFEGNGSWAIGTSNQASLGSGSSGIDTGGKSLVVRGFNSATTNGYAKASRYIEQGGLSAGQYFSVDIAVNYRNGFKGIDVFTRDDAANTETQIFNFNIGGDDYVVSQAATANGSIGNSYSADTVFNIRFDQTTSSGGTWTITRSGGVADVDTGTFTGNVRKIALYVGNTDSGDENNLVFNNLKVGPYQVLDFSINMQAKIAKGVFTPASGHTLEVKGDFNSWGSGNPLSDPDQDGIYTTSFLVAGASGSVFPYRSFANTATSGISWEDRWQVWNATGGASGGSHNRSLVLGADGGTQSISIYFGDDDGVGPVITRTGSATVNLSVNDPYSDDGATSVDLLDGNCEVTTTVSPSGTLATITQSPGTYTITYNSMDAAGNSGAPATRTVVVASAANDGYDAFISGKTTNSQTLAEYAFGATEVGVLATGNRPQVAATGGNLVLSYNVRVTNPALVVVPQLSTDLSGFATSGAITVSTNGQITSNGILLEQRTASVPVDSVPRKFLSLQVQRGQ